MASSEFLSNDISPIPDDFDDAGSDIDIEELEYESMDDDFDLDDPLTFAPAHEWTEQPHDLAISAFDQDSAGVSCQMPPTCKALDFFLMFLPFGFLELLVVQSNLYAEQLGVTWEPVDLDEMRCYIAILIMFGIRHLPQLWCYWSTDPRFNDPWVSSCMSRDRFRLLTRFLHLADSTAAPARHEPNYDPLYKVRPMITLLQGKFLEFYNPGRELSVDETMIGFKGRLFFKQYMPKKPTKWGIKIWSLCDSRAGYCLNFKVYTGATSRVDPSIPLGQEVVDVLTEPYQHRGHHIYMDRFFSSVALAEHLLTVDTRVCGTIMANRRGLPAGVGGRLQRGQLRQWMKGSLMVTSYNDNRQITLLSTNNVMGTAEGQDRPEVLLDYNKYMGGVDKCDQLTSYYPVGRTGNKWWRYLFHYFINLALNQAFHLFTNSPREPALSSSYDQLRFRADVAEQLRNGFSSRKRCGRRSTVGQPLNPEVNRQEHKLVHIEGRQQICVYCKERGKRTAAGRFRECSYKCSFCTIALHRECFGPKHAELGETYVTQS